MELYSIPIARSIFICILLRYVRALLCRPAFQGEDLLDQNVRQNSQNRFSLSIEGGVLHPVESLSCLGIVIWYFLSSIPRCTISLFPFPKSSCDKSIWENHG